MEDRIKLFVGCSPNGEDAESMAVLEYTAKKNSSLPVDITWMKISEDPESPWGGWNTTTWSTPFSGFRWAIPEVCGFEGQAIYMDSDMIILGDLAELWNAPFKPGKIVQAKGGWRFCVAKWDCAAAKSFIMPINRMKKLPEAHQRMFSILNAKEHLVQVFDRQWNNFDGENDKLEDIKILHYTDMSTQPHLAMALERLEARGRHHWFDGDLRRHRREDVIELFMKEYREAVEAGYTVDTYEPDDVIDFVKLSQRGYVAANGFDVTRGE